MNRRWIQRECSPGLLSQSCSTSVALCHSSEGHRRFHSCWWHCQERVVLSRVVVLNCGFSHTPSEVVEMWWRADWQHLPDLVFCRHLKVQTSLPTNDVKRCDQWAIWYFLRRWNHTSWLQWRNKHKEIKLVSIVNTTWKLWFTATTPLPRELSRKEDYSPPNATVYEKGQILERINCIEWYDDDKTRLSLRVPNEGACATGKKMILWGTVFVITVRRVACPNILTSTRIIWDNECRTVALAQWPTAPPVDLVFSGCYPVVESSTRKTSYDGHVTERRNKLFREWRLLGRDMVRWGEII